MLPHPAFSEALAYQLSTVEIAPNTYAVYGTKEHFTRANGGNISNTAFVVTDDGVVVIDTGSSLLYGQALRALIAKTTERDVVRVYNTHHHPDHIFGNQAFEAKTIASLPEVIANIKSDGEMFVENMYRLIGDWMRGTELVAPAKTFNQSSERFGSHSFELIPLAGHTSADLVILDKSTGVLFAGDLTFLDRAATTPHADLAEWHKSLQQLENASFKILLPGHGPAEKSKRAIDQTRDYLKWLEQSLRQAATNGLDMNEAMAMSIPDEFGKIALVREEMERSVAHLFPGFEEELLPLAAKPT